MAEHPAAPQAALCALGRKTLKQQMWGMRRNPSRRSRHQTNVMLWLLRSAHKSARAWRLKMALREVGGARAHNSQVQAATDLRTRLNRDRRCRLAPFKKLAASRLKGRFEAVVRGMVAHNANAFVEAMNCLLQQAKRAARGCSTSKNFIALAHLRMSELSHIPPSPCAPTAPIPD